MAKKIGILNLCGTWGNYGALLNAAALEHVILQWGYDVETLHILPRHQNYARKTLLKRKIGEIIKCVLLRNPNRYDVFGRFRKQHISLSKETFDDAEKLHHTRFDHDAFVVGSDQIWRPQYTGNMALSYFLDFVQEGVPRISYAASFGDDTWAEHPDDFNRKVTECLTRFTAISVREQSGKDICKNTFGVEAEHVLDPTLLVDRHYYDALIGSDGTGDSTSAKIVYYKLDPDHNFMMMLNMLGDEMQSKTKNIYFDEQRLAGKTLHSYFSVPEWLREIRDSRLVVTDSFHCICLAIIFERNFVYVPNDRGLTRLESLLALFNLKDRIVFNKAALEKKTFWQSDIDYQAVNEILATQRLKSRRFLEDALKNA